LSRRQIGSRPSSAASASASATSGSRDRIRRCDPTAARECDGRDVVAPAIPDALEQAVDKVPHRRMRCPSTVENLGFSTGRLRGKRPRMAFSTAS
jgi:hypothetical protein